MSPNLLPCLLLPLLVAARLEAEEEADSFQWLESINSSASRAWVQRQNSRTVATLGDLKTLPAYQRLLALQKQGGTSLPRVRAIRDRLYNFWQDEEHPRGFWRRTTLDEFRKDAPTWEMVLDLDAVSKRDGIQWAFRGCKLLDEGPATTPELCLASLSRGGGDAIVVREFNLTSKEFVPPPFGFELPEAKTSVDYQDRQTLLVGTDTGPGSMTTSGYSRTIREWSRGTLFNESKLVFEVQEEDLSAYAYRQMDRHGWSYDWRERQRDFFHTERFLRIISGPSFGSETTDFLPLSVPEDSAADTFADQLLLLLNSDFTPKAGTTLRSGSIVAAPVVAVLHGKPCNWTVLFEPTANLSCTSWVPTQNFVVLQVLDAMKPSLRTWRYLGQNQWLQESSRGSNLEFSTVTVLAYDASASDAIWLTTEGFLQPRTLSLASSAAVPQEAEVLKQLPSVFNTTGLKVEQRWVHSEKDGTPVPYFLVRKATSDSAPQPTILYGYGGFGIPMVPSYSASLGIAWLEQGGAYALANIRGGGEFGPTWHTSAVREGKHRSYEDFASVAADLVHSGFTTPKLLAATGASNGGLLMGNMLVHYPERFGAIVSEVPLLDMRRYSHLLAGASWVGEYGDPDNSTDWWGFLHSGSPYHNLNASLEYPPTLFITSSRDDRVHPAHARKMAAKMQGMQTGNLRGSRLASFDCLFYETQEGGHAASVVPADQVWLEMLSYHFFAKTIGGDSMK